MNENIGQRIARLRKEKKLTQQQLAELAGYKNRDSINKLERTQNKSINSATAEKLAKALEVPSAYILYGENSSQENKNSFEQYFTKCCNIEIKNISKEDVKELAEYYQKIIIPRKNKEK